MYALIAVRIIRAIDWTPTGLSTPYMANTHADTLRVYITNFFEASLRTAN